MARTLEYAPVYELDYEGHEEGIIAFHLTGHGHTLDDIETFIVQEASSYDEFDPYYTETNGDFNVSEVWVREVQPDNPWENGAYLYVYDNTPDRGGKAFTLVESHSFWGYWCINHPYEPATTGVPASQVTDGEKMVAAKLAEAENQVDPRRVVDDNAYGYRGTIYMCEACADSFHKRREQARKEALAEAVSDA